MNRTKQTGQSLIELMIAMTLGLLLLSFTLTIFQSIRRTSTDINNLISIQETARAMFHILKRDFHTKEIKVLNPNTIPAEIKSQILKNTAPLFLNLNQQKIVYYVSATQRKDTHNNSITEFDRRNLSISRHNQTAMLDGVEDLKLDYGTLNESKLTFHKAQTISNWNTVKAVQFNFKVRAGQMTKAFQFTLGAT